MTKSALFGFILLLASSSLVFAQCDCGDCGGEMPVGSDYTQAGNSGDEWSEFGTCDCGASSCSSGDCFNPCRRNDCDALTKCPYISVFGGWNGGNGFKFSEDVATGADFNSGAIDDGEIYGFAIGSQVHPQVRYELEASFRSNDAESWTIQQFDAAGVVASSVTQAATGDLETYSGMVNFMFDFKPRQVGCWNGYVGGGFGAASIEGQFVTATNTYIVDDNSFAFQFIAGLNRAVTRRADLFVEYRFFSALNVSVFDQTGGVSLGDFEMDQDAVVGGLRFRF